MPAALCLCDNCPRCLNRLANRKHRQSIAYRLKLRREKLEREEALCRREPTPEERAFEKLRRELDPWQQSGSAL